MLDFNFGTRTIRVCFRLLVVTKQVSLCRRQWFPEKLPTDQGSLRTCSAVHVKGRQDSVRGFGRLLRNRVFQTSLADSPQLWLCKDWRKFRPVSISAGMGQRTRRPPLNKELLAVDGCWGRESQFSPWCVPWQLAHVPEDGWLYTSAHTCSVNWTQWVP